MPFEKKEYDREYTKKHLKSINFVLPISEYNALKEHMEKIGEKKVNTYIRKLIANDINNTKNINNIEINQTEDNNNISF